MVNKRKRGLGRRVLVLLLSLAMLAGAAPAANGLAGADESDYTFEILDYENKTVQITGVNNHMVTSLEIPEELYGYKVVGIARMAFSSCESLKNVVIPDSVTSIGSGAFRFTAYYDDPDHWDNGVLYSGNHLIAAKGNLDGVYTVRPGTKTIADAAFLDCRYLDGVVIPEGVTHIGESAFWGCQSLTKLFMAEGVTSIGNSAFKNCGSLKNIALPDSLTHIGESTFSKCGLTEIRIPDGVTRIEESTFEWCRSLSEIVLPDSLTHIGESAFYRCAALTEIRIPDSVTRIEESTFSDCYSLSEIVIPDSVTHIGRNAFENTAYDDDDSNWDDVTEYYTGVLYIGNHLIKAKTATAGSYTVRSGTKTIADAAFSNCKSLTGIVIPEGVVSIGEQAFADCTSLSGIVMPEGVVSIGEKAFSDCQSLSEIVIPDSVTHIGIEAFENTAYCNDLSNWDKSVLYMGRHLIKAQENISGAYTVKPGTKTIVGEAFLYCQLLTEVILPDSVTGIGERAFLDCTSLTGITIPVSVKEIGEYALGYAFWYYEGETYIGETGFFTITGYAGTAAEDYARESGFLPFVALPPELHQLTDPDTGVVVAEVQMKAFPDGARLQAQQASQPDGRPAYDISLTTADGNTVQPAGRVKVSLPVPEGMAGNRCKVYRLEEDGSETDMQAVYGGGTLTFTTGHFSLYAVEELDYTPGDLDGDGSVTIQDVMEACKVLARQSAGKAPTAEEMQAGNLDGDETFSIGDVMEICKILARQA